jgi:hypothetical protein
MVKVTYTIRRKGKVVGRSTLSAEGEITGEAMKAAQEDAARQAKAADVARHAGQRAYRKKRTKPTGR